MFELIAAVISVAGPEATSAGVVLTGGGAQLDGITALARDILKAPVRVAAPEGALLGILDDFQGPSNAAILGLFSWVARSLDEAGIAEEPQAGLVGRVVAWIKGRFSRARS
jgi:cell division protein FtsA